MSTAKYNLIKMSPFQDISSEPIEKNKIKKLKLKLFKNKIKLKKKR